MKQIINSVCIAMSSAMLVVPAMSVAQDLSVEALGKPTRSDGDGGRKRGKGGSADSGGTAPILRGWMAAELQEAWDSGYRGAGTQITVVDDFTSGQTLSGDLGEGVQSGTHGQWTYTQSSFVAPDATMRGHDFSNSRKVALKRGGLNIVNLSYGMIASAGYDVKSIGWSAREESIVSYAKNGNAVISKAAGNDAVAVDGITANGTQDYLALDLIGGQSAIFVGALSKNGSADAPSSLAWYSNYAGNNTTVQDQFLVVGVEGNETGLYGTSFAAPIVSGYAAVIGSKFTKATPTQITRQLLDTARTDTILDYDASRHGKGEASISRALAPVSIK